jgi:MFS family permease
MTALERRTVTALAGLYSFRMLGLFMVLPLLSLYAAEMPGSSALMLGLALGAYGLAQALLQIPLGLLSDRIGRLPVIVGGLLVFALGSILAAQAETVQGIVLGRLLQGAGAIASTVMALVADLTSDTQRTKAMAIVGMSIGASFALALVVGPLLAAWGGLALVFYATAVLALIGILIVFFAVPRVSQVRHTRGETGTVPGLIWRSLKDPGLARLNLGVFCLHFILMALFVALPLVLERQIGIDRDLHWRIYLPTLVLSIAGMVPLMILAERSGRLKLAFFLAIAAIALSQWSLSGAGGAWVLYAGLWLFFAGFNYLEASLPSLVSKTVYAGGKGTALGVYSTFQFLGAFAGGAGGGLAMEFAGSGGVFLCCTLVALAWMVLALGMRAPRNLINHVVRLPVEQAQMQARLELLRAADGVEDLLLLDEERTLYLKVDESSFDPGLLEDAQA